MATDTPHNCFPEDEPDDDALAALSALLAEPAMWEQADPDTEDAIVAMISAEIEAASSDPETTNRPTELPRLAPITNGASSKTEPIGGATVIPISMAHRWLRPVGVGVAAAIVLIAGYALGANSIGRDDGTEFALAATELAPGGEATAVISETLQGTRIRLDVSGLPPAADGSYYEAWLRQNAEIGVSAGTFHLRGGDDGVIELWAGVSVEDYPLFTITVQDEAVPDSSGQVVLKVNTAADS